MNIPIGKFGLINIDDFLDTKGGLVNDANRLADWQELNVKFFDMCMVGDLGNVKDILYKNENKYEEFSYGLNTINDAIEPGLLVSCYYGHYKIVEEIIKYKNINQKYTSLKFNVLAYAAAGNNFEIIKLLLDNGAKVGNGSGDYTYSAVRESMRNRNKQIFNYLVEHDTYIMDYGYGSKDIIASINERYVGDTVYYLNKLINSSRVTEKFISGFIHKLYDFNEMKLGDYVLLNSRISPNDILEYRIENIKGQDPYGERIKKLIKLKEWKTIGEPLELMTSKMGYFPKDISENIIRTYKRT